MSKAAKSVVVPCRVYSCDWQSAPGRSASSDSLRALQRLDRRLLVDGQNQSIFGRLHVKADHRSRLGREIGIVAFAPALAPGEIDLVGAQEAPDILHIDVAEGFGD